MNNEQKAQSLPSASLEQNGMLGGEANSFVFNFCGRALITI